MADEGIKAGDAYVDVTLRMPKDAFAKLAADNNAAANKAGDTLGDRIGKAIAKRIAQSVRDGLTQGGAGVGTQGTKVGDDFGGKFADTAKRRIEAALRSLPTPQIGVATTEADQKLRDLHNRLNELSGKRVGIDIDAAEALAEIRRLKAEIDELGAKSPSVQVRVDAAAAAAELAALTSEVQDLDGRTVDIDTSTNAGRSASDVFSLVNAVTLLGPAAVPSAAAAAAAILGIGAAATSVFAAVGIGKLAFAGVGGALTAMSAAQQDAAKTGATLGQQQDQLASGADQVKSAEASLANARASAADSLRQANERVAQSQRDLTDAERSAQRAQVALTAAQQDAARQIEDLNTSVEDGALAQRRALEDQAKAQSVLTSVQTAGSTATQQQRDDAQLTFDEATQHVKDLNIQQARAVADQDAANKAGVAGSKQVVAAQDQVLQANEKVADAQRGIADAEAARTAASRQAAFSIAQAQQQVASSQRSIGQAILATSTTGGAALDALQKALGNLSPEGQKFATFLFSLKPRLDQLKESAQNGLFPGLQAGLVTILPYFGQVDRLVGTVAADLGSLGRVAAGTFTDPFWRQFGGFLAGQIVPNLHLVYLSVLNVAEGGARIIQAFAPVEQTVGTKILGLTDKFVAFSRAAGQNQGLQQFVKFATAEVPHVISTIEALGTAGVHIVQAYAPIGSVVVSGLRILSDIIDAIPVPVVTALAAAFTAYRLSAVLAGLATTALNSGFAQGIAKMITFRTVTTETGASTTGLQRAVTSAAGVIGGGLFTAALTGATVIIGVLLAKQQEAKAQLDALQQSAAQYASTLKGGLNPATVQQAATLLQQNSALRGLVQTTGQLGISTQTLVAGLNGDKTARGQVIDAINAEIDRRVHLKGLDADALTANLKTISSLNDMRTAFAKQNTAMADTAALQQQIAAQQQQTNNAFTTVAGVLNNAAASADDYKTAIDAVGGVSAEAGAKADVLATIAGRVADSQLDAAGKATVFGQVLDGIGESATTNGPVFDSLSKVFESISRASLDAHDKVNLLNEALQGLYQPSIDLNEANEGLVKSQADLQNQLKTSGAGFDLSSAKSKGNTTAILQNRDALEAALKATRDKYVQDLASNVSEDTARATHDKTIATILAGIPTRQRDTQAVKDLVTEYGDVPKKVSTDVSAPGLDAAISQLIQAHAIQYGLEQHPPWSKDQIANEAAYLQRVTTQGLGGVAAFKAEGGHIQGPGTATSDSIPAMLSNNEFVHRAAAVDYYGVSLMSALNAKAIPREALPGFAAGGSVSWPVAIPSSPQAVPSVTELWKMWNAARAAAVAGSVARSGISGLTAGAVAGALANLGPLAFDPNLSGLTTAKVDGIKRFLHAVDPLPYVFGAAGPKGFDCSGLASAIYGLMLGKGGGSGERYFTTYDFANGAPKPFKPGANGGTLAIGVNPQEHMAGNFAGLPFEAKSTAKGIVVGAGVTPLGAFQKQFHMAQGGLVNPELLDRLGIDIGGDASGMTVNDRKVPYKLFDDGGWLMPGLTLADNRTGSPELIQTPAQTAASGPTSFNVILEARDPAVRDLMSLIDVRVEAGHDRVAAAVGSGVRDY